MNMDAVGTAVVPVASDGTIALATSAGATDVTLDVVGYYPPGDVPNTTEATPGEACRWATSRRRRPPAPAPAPAPEAPAFAPELPDEFISIGAEVGYESSAQGPLQPGEERVVGLAGVPGEATAALVLITTREATKRGKVRIGSPDKDPEATFQFPKRGVRSAVMVVPVVGSQVKFVTSKKAAVQLRVEVLGYSLNAKPIKVRSVPPPGSSRRSSMPAPRSSSARSPASPACRRSRRRSPA